MQLAQRRSGLSNCFGGETRQRLIPLGDGIRYERLEPERQAIRARAVATSFPKAIDELGQWSDPFVRSSNEWISGDLFVRPNVTYGSTSRKDHSGSLRNGR